MTPKMLLKTGLILLHAVVDSLQLVVQEAQHLQAHQKETNKVRLKNKLYFV